MIAFCLKCQGDLEERRTPQTEPRSYEHEKPGDLLYVDVKKLGKVPDGGG